MADEFRPAALARMFLMLENLGQPDADKMLGPIEARPIDMTVEVNSFNEADAFTLEFDHDLFPFDPRVVRGGVVELYLARVVEDEVTFWRGLGRDGLKRHCVFVGVIDQVENVFDDEGRRTVIEGRDYTAYFLDSELATKDPESGNKLGEVLFKDGTRKLSLKEVIERLVKQRPKTQNILVDPLKEAPEVFPSDYLSKDSRKYADGETAWQAIQELALEAGAIVYVEKDSIRIREPRTVLVDGSRRGDGYEFTIGHNVKSVRPQRILGKAADINVVLTSRIPGHKKPLIAYEPDKKDAAAVKQSTRAQITAGQIANDAQKKPNKDVDVTYRYFVMRGIRKQSVLEKAAKSIWEQLRHHEIRVDLKTDSMTDTNGQSVLGLCFGEPVFVSHTKSLAPFVSLDGGDALARLSRAGWDVAEAQRLKEVSGARFTPYYLHHLTHRFNAETGYSLDMHLRGRKQVVV